MVTTQSGDQPISSLLGLGREVEQAVEPQRQARIQKFLEGGGGGGQISEPNFRM